MKVLLLVALIGAAVAHHVPGHMDYDYVFTRHADAMPTRFTERIVDQPVVVVTKTTRFAPEMVAILVENGVNNMPESLDSFHDLMRSSISEGEEFMLCNGGIEGRLDFCMEKPIAKLLVPEAFKDLSVVRLINEMPAMPWVHMPILTRSMVPSSRSELEVFDKPILIVRAVPMSEETVPEEHIFKSLYNVPLNNYNAKYFTDDSFVKSFKPLSRSVSPAHWPVLTKVHKSIDNEGLARFYTPSHFKSFDNVDLVRNIKPIVKYDEIIAKPFLRNFDTIIEKPTYKNFDFVEKPMYKNFELIETPVLKNYDTIIEKPFLKNVDTIIEKPTYKDFDVIEKPMYKNFELIETPVVKNYDTIIEKPFIKNYDTIIERPALKSFIKPLLKNYDAIIAKPAMRFFEKPIVRNVDTIIEKPFLKNFDSIIEKPILKHYDEILAKPYLKDYVSSHIIDTPAVLPASRSFLPKVAYETLY